MILNSCLRYLIYLSQLPRCKRSIQESCIDSLDLMNCNAAFQFCGSELSAPYRLLGVLFRTSLYDRPI